MTHPRGNFLHTHLRTIAGLAFGLIFSITVVHATPPGSPYTAGETLDPTCAPGDTNCSVTVFPDQTGNSGKFLTTNGTTTSWASSTVGNLQTVTDSGATTTNTMTVLKTGTGSTITDALLIENTTTAGFGTPQYSPTLHFQGQGYATGSAVSSPVDFRIFTFTGNGSSPTLPGGRLVIQSQTNSGGYTERLGINAESGLITTNGGSITTAGGGTITSAGLLTAQSGITTTGTFALSGASSPVTLNSSVGTSGQVLTSAGAGATPTWTTPTALKVSNLLAATTANTIDNLNWNQDWQWNLLASTTAFKISSTSTNAVSNAQKLFQVDLSGNNVFSTQTTYAMQVSNSHTGTASTNYASSFVASGGTTNIAGYFGASGGTNNYAAIFGAGNVGIGTITPAELLSIGTSGSTKGVFSLAGNTSGKITIQPAAAAGTWTWTLPTDGGTSGYLLSTDGSGVTSWIAAPGSLTGATSGTKTFLGISAGSGASSNSTTMIGASAGQSASSSDNSTFIGYEAGRDASSSASSVFVGFDSGIDASSAYNSNFIGYSAGQNADNSYQANFIGYNAGYNAGSSNDSVFIGINAGYSASGSTSSTFIGPSAGYNAGSSTSSVFIGTNAGSGASSTNTAVFIGPNAGSAASSSTDSVFIGNNAGSSILSTYAPNSIFIGPNAGADAAFAGVLAANSIFIGSSAGYNDTIDNTGGSTSILIGNNTSTANNPNSIALGTYATNTAANQFMIGSSTSPIDETRINGSAGTQCTITTGTGINCTSDERLKTNITDLGDDTLAKLRDIRTVTFNWRDNPSSNTQIGFIAQNLEPLFPELVATDPQGYKGVYYSQITPVLVKAIQELDLRISALELGQSNDAKAFFTDVLDHVEGGVAYLRDLVVGTIKVGSPDKRTGVTLYDEVTGEPYCLSIANGETKTTTGECSVTEPTDETPVPDENPPADAPANQSGGEDIPPETVPPTDDAVPPAGEPTPPVDIPPVTP